VHAEAGLCGCPVITSDFGIFPETVENGVTGWRVRTLGEAMWAARHAQLLDRKQIRAKSLARFSLEAVASQYEDWFRRLAGLRDEGLRGTNLPPHTDWRDESPGRFAQELP
jgi:glycosyltransferase involved in cell wall biosynthesis